MTISTPIPRKSHLVKHRSRCRWDVQSSSPPTVPSPIFPDCILVDDDSSNSDSSFSILDSNSGLSNLSMPNPKFLSRSELLRKAKIRNSFIASYPTNNNISCTPGGDRSLQRGILPLFLPTHNLSLIHI